MYLKTFCSVFAQQYNQLTYIVSSVSAKKCWQNNTFCLSANQYRTFAVLYRQKTVDILYRVRCNVHMQRACRKRFTPGKDLHMSDFYDLTQRAKRTAVGQIQKLPSFSESAIFQLKCCQSY